MTRLATIGFESGSSIAEGMASALTVNATAARIGGLGAQCHSAVIDNAAPFTGVLARWYYARAYFYIPTGAVSTAGTGIVGLRTVDSGIEAAWSAATAGATPTFGWVSFVQETFNSNVTCARDTWHMAEVGLLTNSNIAINRWIIRLNGVQVADVTGGFSSATAVNGFSVGPSTFNTGADTGNYYVDDAAFNDDQGANQNSWPGPGHVALLKPISDNARGANWTAGAGGTTNLWDAVNNTPPVGVALASATNTSQVKNAAKDSAGTYDANVQSYTTGGLGAADTVTLTQPIAVIGNGAATARSMAVTGVSNPASAEVLGNTLATAAGTFPTGWTTLFGTVSYAPAVTLGTSPVVRVRRNTSNNTDANMACFMGMIVESVPGVARLPLPIATTLAAVRRSRTW